MLRLASRPSRRSRLLLVGAVLCVVAPVAGAPAQSAANDSATAAKHGAGRRETAGRRILTAIAAKRAIRLDGVLDEPIWARAPRATDFVQSEPAEGQPATERTEVRVLYDADFIYVGAWLSDSDPRGVVVNDIRKDFSEDIQDDFEVLFDTFGDRRNAYVFSTNVEGARHDRQVALEGREVNESWDAVWDVRTRVGSEGWTVEMRIPFRALRFDKGTDRAWGLNFSRHIRRKNEVDFWSPVPRAYNLNRVSLAGDLEGLQTGNAGRDLRVKPYVAASTTRPMQTAALPDPHFAGTTDIGVDVKAAVTPGLTGDLTVNPDFAQVEADEQQVNLTQFSQFYPEKRDFFLENSGIFYVGDAARNNRVNPTPTPDEDNLLFFSRRVGLTSNGLPVTIQGGGRLTGKVGETLRIGVLDVQEAAADGRPAFNSAVLRLRQNLWGSGSDIGLLVMQHEATSGPAYSNRVYGVDKNIRLFGNLDWNSYAIRSETPGVSRGNYAWRSTVNWEGDFEHFKAGLMQLGAGFSNDLGYYRRTDVRKWLLDTGLRPRSTWLHDHGIREIHPHLTWDYQESIAGTMVGKRLHSGNSFFFNNGAVIEFSYNPVFQRITDPFTINTAAAAIPAGGYGWFERMIYVVSDQSQALSTSFRYIWGGLWSGTQQTLNGTATWRASYHFLLTAGLQRTDATLPQGSFVSSLYTLRGNYSFSTNMFIDALMQYDRTSRQMSSNVRFNLIHHPLSDLFIVYNDQRILTADGGLPGRGLIVKFTQMMAF